MPISWASRPRSTLMACSIRARCAATCRHASKESALRRVHWSELTTVDFAALDAETTIAVLPVAAIEQHGPHLPVSTDTAIGEGLIAETLRRLPEDLSILILPTQAIGKSNEHLRSPGT